MLHVRIRSEQFSGTFVKSYTIKWKKVMKERKRYSVSIARNYFSAKETNNIALNVCYSNLWERMQVAQCCLPDDPPPSVYGSTAPKIVTARLRSWKGSSSGASHDERHTSHETKRKEENPRSRFFFKRTEEKGKGITRQIILSIAMDIFISF